MTIPLLLRSSIVDSLEPPEFAPFLFPLEMGIVWIRGVDLRRLNDESLLTLGARDRTRSPRVVYCRSTLAPHHAKLRRYRGAGVVGEGVEGRGRRFVHVMAMLLHDLFRSSSAVGLIERATRFSHTLRKNLQRGPPVSLAFLDAPAFVLVIRGQQEYSEPMLLSIVSTNHHPWHLLGGANRDGGDLAALGAARRVVGPWSRFFHVRSVSSA